MADILAKLGAADLTSTYFVSRVLDEYHRISHLYWLGQWQGCHLSLEVVAITIQHKT